MDFRILGSLEVVDDGRAVPIRGARQRAVLGALLVNANRVVSADRLIDAVWGDGPPSSGAAALQMRVTQLRRTLITLQAPASGVEEPLVTVPGGYVLRVGANDIDALRFERLVAEGQALAAERNFSAASMCLCTARALWRGPALSDFAYEPFAQAEIVRLEELRLITTEEWLEAELALGRHSAVVPELEALVGAHPLRERLRASLMIALYRSARQADALAAYREARAYLSQELGVEPGTTLQRLEQQILRHAADLEPEIPGAAGATRPVTASVQPSRKPITVVCMSVRASAEAPADVDPERRSRVLARCLAVGVQAFEEHGALARRLPGAVLAAFGSPVVGEDDALRAVRAAVGVHERVVTLAGELEPGSALRVQARSGIATGDVLTRDGAPDDVWETGEPADAALELSTRANPGEVLIADSTEPLIRHAAVLTRRAPSPASAAWRLRTVTTVHGSHAVRRDAPFVGRESELAELERVVERAAAQRSVHTCTVVGAAGVGKSRLVQEFGDSAGETTTVVTGVCAPYGEIATFSPLREVVEKVAAGRSLVEVMHGAEHADMVARLVEAAVGMSDATGIGDVFWAVGRFLEAGSRDGPLVVVLEDVHWASPTMLALVEFLSGWQRPAALALVCLARPELLAGRPGWLQQPQSALIELSPLDPAEIDILLGHLSGGDHLATDVRQRLARAAEGNPLFLEQLLAMLIEHPGLDVDADLPPTIAALLAARLDRLGPGERAVLERAAVVGRVFHRDAVAALLPVVARSTADRHLAALAARDLVTVHDHHDAAATHRFRHGLIHAAAYRSGPTGAHAELHESLAWWLDAADTSTDEVVGHHLERAVQCRLALGNPDDHTRELAGRAAQRLCLAGEQAHRRGDMPASASLLERARRLPTGDDGTALEVLPDLGYALFEVGELQGAETILAEAVARADALHRPKVRWRAAVTLMHLGMYQRPEALHPDDLLRSASEAVQELERLDDDVGVARALMFASEVHWIAGRPVATQQAAEMGLAFAERSRSRREEAWCRGQLGFALINGPVPVGVGLRRCREMLLATRGDPVAEANLLLFVALHEAMAGEFPDALDHAAAGRTATRELGLRWQTGIHSLLSSQVCLLSGDPVEAETLVRSALATFKENEDAWDVATAARAKS
jgi:DNA-binding SARP family transcriptional activator